MATSVSLQRASHPDQPAIPVTDGLALGRNLLCGGPHDFAYVSRKQAECTLLDGQLLIVSCGSNPTGVKPQGANGWSWLAKGQERVLSEVEQRGVRLGGQRRLVVAEELGQLCVEHGTES